MSKVILITGASSGLGLAIASYLAMKGFVVYGSSRTIKNEGFSFKTVPMNVCDKGSVIAAVNTIVEAEGKIDVVINNAGLGILGPVECLQEEDFLKAIDTNLLGALRVIQAVLPSMRKNQSGLIINISSIASEMGLPYRGAYSASKAALNKLTEALRIETKKYGIQACIVQPGGVATDIGKNRLFFPLEKDSCYEKSFNSCQGIINDSVKKGLSPEIFGPEIEKIINTSKVKRTYRIGKATEKLSVLLKRVLPSSVFDKILKNHYKV